MKGPTTLWLKRTNVHRGTATVCGIWLENKDWSKQQEQINPTAATDNGSHAAAMPLISWGRATQAEAKSWSLPNLQPIGKQSILGYFLCVRIGEKPSSTAQCLGWPPSCTAGKRNWRTTKQRGKSEWDSTGWGLQAVSANREHRCSSPLHNVA